MRKCFWLALLAALILTGSPALAKNDSKAEQTVIRAGTNPSGKANPDNFTGSVRVDPAFRAVDPGRAYGAYVTFEPGARTNWHVHPLGQVLIVGSGKGITQERGKAAQIILPGDVVVCPPGVPHWHGAAPDTAMTHLAIGESSPEGGAKWLDKVDDAQYQKAIQEVTQNRP